MTATHCYVGRHATCGHVRAVIIDDAGVARDVAKFVARMVRDGLHVERMTVADFKADKTAFNRDCPVCNPPKTRKAKTRDVFAAKEKA